jgi:hypothetical protein
MSELSDRWAQNNDPTRPVTYVQPVLGLIVGALFLASATSILAVIVSVVLITMGALELAMLTARLWMRRRMRSR